MGSAVSILEASLAYAARGLAIFPVRGKLPLTKRGFHDATTDPRIIREWYAGWPDAGIGLPTGAVNGRIVVDVDDDEAFEAFQREHGRLPSTATVLTPRGGRHLHYRHPGNGHVVRSVAGFRGFVGLDVRGDGGYVVVPPSPGYIYELGTEDVADAPAVLLEVAPPRAMARANGTAAQIREGARNSTLASEAGRLRRLGMSEVVIEAALLALNNERCRPLLSTDEVRRIAASIARYPAPEKSVAVTPSSRNPKRDEPYAGNGTRRTSQSSRLVELCADVDLFHARDGEAYGTVAVDDHRETWPVRSSVFRDFLRRRYFDAHGAVPGAQPLGEAVDLIAARGRFSGETREVDLRLAGHAGRIYLDLCNDDWGVVEIGRDGWRVVADAPVRFRRARGMLPLPTPTPGGSLELLRPFLNVGDDERRWKLIVGWLVGLLHPGGPHAVLAVSGEQGSAKTTQGRILRALHDPNESPDRTTPRSELDLAIAARNGRIIVLDNMSGLKPWLSDGLARLATGSGLTTRKLYTDDEETIFHACRPILLERHRRGHDTERPFGPQHRGGSAAHPGRAAAA